MLQLYLTIACLSVIGAADLSLLQNLHMPCPVVDCAYMYCPSGQYTQNYMIINGRKCPSCQTCEQTLLQTRQLHSLLQMPCPIFDCMYLDCPSGQYKQNYMTINGKKCPSCASCVDSAKVARQIEVCPFLNCPYLECPASHILRVDLMHDTLCPLCPVCTPEWSIGESVVTPDLMECPLYHCVMPNCPRGQYHEGYTLVHGHECPACPICTQLPVLNRAQNQLDEQAGFTCPSPMCVASESCSNAHLVDSFYKFRGQQCPGCSVCEKNNEKEN